MIPRVLVISDHIQLMDALCASLEAQNDPPVVQTTRSGGSGMLLFQSAPFDVVILDAELPDMPGVELMRKLRDASPQVALFVLHRGHDQAEYAYLRFGANVTYAIRDLEECCGQVAQDLASYLAERETRPGA